jgi:hypothetical protein
VWPERDAAADPAADQPAGAEPELHGAAVDHSAGDADAHSDGAEHSGSLGDDPGLRAAQRAH